VGHTQRLAIGDDSSGVSSGQEHVRAQRKQRPAYWLCDIVPDSVDQCQRVAVRPDGGVGAGGLQQIRCGVADVASLQHVVTDPRWGRAEIAQRPGCLTVQRQ
jgi:hypothetical protein